MRLKLLLLVFSLLLPNLTYSQAIFYRDARFHPVIVPAGLGVVVSQDSIASQVGADILASGGNAVDAAVATGFALAVTFPQAGNIGGGGFMLVRMADGAENAGVYALDYRETAPATARPDMYINQDGSIDVQEKRFGIKSTAIPGTVAGLLLAQEKWGRLTRQQVLAPAINLARQGFLVGNSLAYSLDRASSRFQTEATKAYFLGVGKQGYKPGELFVQTDLANTLERISKQGAVGFYEGETAELIVSQVDSLGGSISLDDLKSYRPALREALVGHYRGYEVLSMPPPSSGGVHLIQMLNILEQADLNAIEHNSSGYIHLLAETMKPAYADRSLHLGDPDFSPVPVEELLAKTYAKSLWEKISTDRARPSEDILPTHFQTEESADTTHYSVWDAEGNMVSNTYTLNFSYGNGIAVEGAGFLLNNEMDDFSARPGAINAYGLVGSRANSIEPGKRPLSSMTPTLVLKNGKPFMVTGSPGGSRIITAVLQSILNAVDYDMNAAEIVSAPRFHHQWLPDMIFWERGISQDTRDNLIEKGQNMVEKPRNFGKLEVILKRNGVVQAAADPRWPDSGVAIQPE